MAYVNCNNILKSFPKYESCPGYYKLQFHILQFPGHLSYFRKDFKMQLADKEVEI